MADVTTRVAARLSAAVEPFARRAEEASTEPVKSPRTAVVVGRLLGVALLTCFATGL